MEKNYQIYDMKERMLFAAVGQVISKWATLETTLLGLAAFGLQMNMRDAAKLTSAFKAFALSLDFTQAVCGPRLKDTVFLNSLVDLIREVSGDRNFIAHTEISAHATAAPHQLDWADATPHVGPALKEHFAQHVQKRDSMDIFEVSEIAADIQYLIELTMAFVDALRAGGPLPEKFRVPVVPRRPRLSVRRAQSGKAPSSRSKP